MACLCTLHVMVLADPPIAIPELAKRQFFKNINNKFSSFCLLQGTNYRVLTRLMACIHGTN